MKEEKQQEPFLKLVQTSSSHEPFEVPFHRLDDKVLNAFAYADSCVGDFIKQYQELPQWKNTVFVLVPDHQGRTNNPSYFNWRRDKGTACDRYLCLAD